MIDCPKGGEKVMKKTKVTLVLLIVVMVATAGLSNAQVRGKQDYWNNKTHDPQASMWAARLSCMFPGTGEWYNRDFRGEFPLAECILGSICPLVSLCSFFDAAAGDTSDKIRLDFWSLTNNNSYVPSRGM